jgi:outer membrane protein TolC
VSQQDVLRRQLEASNLESELVKLQQQLRSAQAKLARLLHVSPDTPVRAADTLPDEEIPRDLERLYQQAIAARPELHAQLAAIERDRGKAKLARLNCFPDVTLGFTWINTAAAGISPVANGRDAFLLGATANLPVYRKRLSAGVREAQAQAVAAARQYDSLRDQTLEEVADLFAQAASQQELLQLLREDMIPTAEQTLTVSIQAYDVGQVDFLQLIDNWRQLLRLQIARERLEADLRQTLASLERVVGKYNGPSRLLHDSPPADNVAD